MLANEKIIYALIVTVSFLLAGTFGYVLIEHFSVLEALYMTVITISTVGYGEIRELSGPGRIFTMFLIVFGLGSIAFLAHSFTEAIIERVTSQNLGRKQMLKKVRQLSRHHIICGFGRVGQSAAERLHAKGVDFVVVEADEEQIKIIRDLGYNYIEGDATREQILLDAGIKKGVSLLALLDEDPDNLFVVLTARELNPTLQIIARTEVASSESRMLKAGADSVLSIYASAGRRVADKITEMADGPVSEAYENRWKIEQIWITVTEGSGLADHVVETADTFLGAKIIGIRRDDVDMLAPDGKEQLCLGDELLIEGKRRDQGDTIRELPDEGKKIVLVDDNPVIRGLYTRLFQKAGFRIFTAADGQNGFDLIVKERPDAAVIDCHLPDISGLELCRKVQSEDELASVKLFMFTGDDEEQTRAEALAVGVDTVVLKSPDAREIICTVSQGLDKK